MSSREASAAVVLQSATTLYGDGQQIWFESDRWNAHKRKKIEKFVLGATKHGRQISGSVLDAGSGSTVYSWMPADCVSVDRFFRQVENKRVAAVGDLEALPFADGCFDFAFCIGSVLNYVSALEALHELSRVLKRGGCLFLHFETSSSFEQLGRPSWNASAHLHKTLNSSREDHIWLYSPAFIDRILKRNKLRVLRRNRFHVFSALLLRLAFQYNHQLSEAEMKW